MLTITDVRIHKLIVPMKPDTVHSPGVEDKLCAPDPVTGRSLNFWDFPKWVVELVANNGLVGLGEPRRGDVGEPLRQHADLIIGMRLPDLAGNRHGPGHPGHEQCARRSGRGLPAAE